MSPIGRVRSSQAEDLNGLEVAEVEEREGHGPFSQSHPIRRKSPIEPHPLGLGDSFDVAIKELTPVTLNALVGVPVRSSLRAEK